MMIPIETEKGFELVERSEPASPSERFERRAEEIACAAEQHVRRMLERESTLLAGGSVPVAVDLPRWTVEPENRDDVPCGLRRRVVLRVPLLRRDAAPRDEPAQELRRIRSLMAQLALDLISQVIEINRYFAEAGLVKAPEVVEPGERGEGGP